MILLPLFCVLALTACASKTPVQRVFIKDVMQNIKYKNILFKEFGPGPGVKANIPTAGPLHQCKTTAISYLAQKDIFEKVEDIGDRQANQNDGPTLIVEGSLSYLKMVSTARRICLWVLAGRSAMRINIKLTDASTGTVIAQQELIGAPGAMTGAWSVGAADRALPVKMGYLVGDFIFGNVGE